MAARHSRFAVIEKAIELGMEILLRVPNLSFVLQGEDTVNFKETKAEFRVQKTQKFSELNKDRLTHLHGHKPLTWEHFMPCFLPAWKVGFTMERNLKGWALEGLIPFTRNALWRKRGAPPQDSISSSWRASTRNSFASSATAVELPAFGSGAAASPTPASGTEQTSAMPPANVGPVPDRVKEAKDYIENSSFTWDDQQKLSFDQVLAHNLRLQEASKVVAEWVASIPQKKPSSTRITAKTLFGLKGSATGEEGRAMARKKADEAQAEKMSKAAKQEQAKQKKALEVAALVTKGAHLLQVLEEKGPSHVSGATLSVADILALLTHADPQGNIIKPKKKDEGVQRVRALGSVQAALTRHAAAAAAAAVAAAAAAPPPQPSFPPSGTAMEFSRPSIGSTGSSDASQPPVVPMGPAVL